MTNNNFYFLFSTSLGALYHKSVRPFDRWLKQFTSVNRNLLTVVEKGFSFPDVSIFGAIRLLGPHRVQNGPASPPSCVADMGGIIGAIRQTDRWQSAGGPRCVSKAKEEEKVCFFFSSLAYWPSYSLSSSPCDSTEHVCRVGETPDPSSAGSNREIQPRAL